MLIAPVGIESIGWTAPRWPSRMIEPFAELLLDLADRQLDRLAAFAALVSFLFVSDGGMRGTSNLESSDPGSVELGNCYDVMN